MPKRTYLRERLKKVLGLGFAAGDQGVIETIEANRKALEEIKASLGLAPETTPDEALKAVRAMMTACAEMRSPKS